MIEILDLDGELTIVDVGAAPPLSDAVAARVDDLWQEEKARRGDALYDDPIFNLTARDGARLQGAFVPYRWFVAQRADPRLDELLRVRPLGVMGLPWVEGGLLFALRSTEMVVDPGLWELPPSGGIDLGARRADGRIAAVRQLLAELREELEVGPESIVRCAPIALVSDSQSRITEVAFELELGLSFAALKARHAASANREYTELRLVERGDLDSFRGGQSGRLTSAARALLEHRRLI